MAKILIPDIREYENNAALKNGTPVAIQLLMPDHRKEYLEGFGKLSAKSKYHRFLSPIRELPESMVDYFLEIDNINHLAWCGIDTNIKKNQGMGVARYIRIKGIPDTAEFAVAVIDKYQNNGLGTILLKYLFKSALKNGINTLAGHVLTDNKPMLKILKNLKGTMKREDAALFKIELSLPLLKDYISSVEI